MKKSTDILTLQELETLCQLYMDCRMSVAEETELEYVLRNTDRTSALIAETRRLMNIACQLDIPAVRKPAGNRFIQRARLYGAAACIASLIALGTVVFSNIDNYNTSASPTTSEVLIAYCNGHKLNGMEAQVAVNQAMEKADSLMVLASEIERQNALKAQSIINLTSD